jgi:hypothetical protein
LQKIEVGSHVAGVYGCFLNPSYLYSLLEMGFPVDGLMRTGVADLRLHGGVAPDYLVRRMIRLTSAILDVFVDEFGADKLLERLANPLWFQALSCTLGYDWDSSGTTTVTCGVLKTATNPLKHGFVVCGGKGKRSLETQTELERSVPKAFDFSNDDIAHLKYASRIAAKVDNAAIQDGYQLYHHTFLVTEQGNWAVIQQGMNTSTKTVRRYHWLSTKVRNFVEEPHTGIVCDKSHGNNVLNMTSRDSEGCRSACTDIVSEGVNSVMRAYSEIKTYSEYGTTLEKWMGTNVYDHLNPVTHYRLLPRRMNWDALKDIYDIHPRNYEQLLGTRGVGPATVRGLALISELLYGEAPSWQDPVRYSFAFGGKDGVPFPVERKAMDEAAQILEQAIDRSKLGEKDRIGSIRRLREFIKNQ